MLGKVEIEKGHFCYATPMGPNIILYGFYTQRNKSTPLYGNQPPYYGSTGLLSIAEHIKNNPGKVMIGIINGTQQEWEKIFFDYGFKKAVAFRNPVHGLNLLKAYTYEV